MNSPREVLKQAFANAIIVNGQLWITMLDERNLLSQIYDDALAKKVVNKICNDYIAGIEQLNQFLLKKLI